MVSLIEINIIFSGYNNSHNTLSNLGEVDFFNLRAASEFDFTLLDLIRSPAGKESTIRDRHKKELETVYIGARKAPIQCRIYDKAIQQKDPEKGDLGAYLKSVGITRISKLPRFMTIVLS